MLEVTTLSELTIDGKLALGPGASSKELFAFYGDELRAWFHAQRAAADAIMVGAGTVRADDPELTVRHVPGPNPLRVVPSSDGRLPTNAQILTDGRPTMVAVSRAASGAAVMELTARPNVEVVTCGEVCVDLVELTNRLEARGVRRLLVEGGSRLLHSFFAADLVTRIVIKHIPVIAGRQDAPGFLGGSASIPRSRWRLEELFMKGGIAVSIYRSLATQ